MKQLISNLKNYVVINGHFNSRFNTFEVVNHHFIIYSSDLTESDLSIDHIEYANDKIQQYREDIQFLINKLKEDSQSRQAVVSFEIKSDLPNCMLSIQVQIRKSQIYCSVYQRSLDIVGKLPQDALIAKIICDIVANQFNLVSNHQIDFFVGNSHVLIN